MPHGKEDLIMEESWAKIGSVNSESKNISEHLVWYSKKLIMEFP